jgi:hypothetical protein
VFLGMMMWIDILRLNKIGLPRLFFLNFRSNGKR